MRQGTGPSGEVRVGYQVAVSLGRWHMAPRGVIGDPNPRGAWGVTTEDWRVNAYWLSTGGPFDCVLSLYDGRRLRWRNVQPIEEERCFRVLGARSDPEEA